MNLPALLRVRQKTHSGRGFTKMQYAAIDELEKRIAARGWALAVRQLLSRDVLRWWLEKRGKSPGRLVVIEFHQGWYQPAVSTGGPRSVLSQIRVRPAAWLGGKGEVRY